MFDISDAMETPQPSLAPIYDPFMGDSPDASRHVAVTVESSPPRYPAASFAKLFATEAWDMWGRAGERVVVRRFGASGTIRWVASFRTQDTATTLTCGDGPQQIDGPFVRSPFGYPLDQILTTYALSGRGAVIHGAGVLVHDDVYVLAGPSGAGKSTISTLLANEDVHLLSDDRILIWRDGDGLLACGTPWPGEAGYADPTCGHLRGLLFLSQSLNNGVVRLSRRKTLQRLLPVMSVLWYDRAVLPACLDFCDQLVQRVPALEFDFTPDARAVDCLLRWVGTA